LFIWSLWAESFEDNTVYFVAAADEGTNRQVDLRCSQLSQKYMNALRLRYNIFPLCSAHRVLLTRNLTLLLLFLGTQLPARCYFISGRNHPFIPRVSVQTVRQIFSLSRLIGFAAAAGPSGDKLNPV